MSLGGVCHLFQQTSPRNEIHPSSKMKTRKFILQPGEEGGYLQQAPTYNVYTEGCPDYDYPNAIETTSFSTPCTIDG